MKKMKIGIIAGALLVSTNLLAASEGDQYAGIQYTNLDLSDSSGDSVSPSAIVGRFGVYINESVSVEGRLGIGAGDDTIDAGPFDIAIELDTLYGVYGVGHMPINESASVYGVIGFTQAEATASAMGFSESFDDSGLSYGIGADIGISDTVALNLEFMQYMSKSDFDLTGVSAGVTFSF